MAANKFKMAAIRIKCKNSFTKSTLKFKLQFSPAGYFSSGYNNATLKFNVVSQVQQAKQFKMAARQLKIWKKSLISNLTLKFEAVVFKDYISLQVCSVFNKDVLAFDITIYNIKTEKTSKMATRWYQVIMTKRDNTL